MSDVQRRGYYGLYHRRTDFWLADWMDNLSVVCRPACNLIMQKSFQALRSLWPSYEANDGDAFRASPCSMTLVQSLGAVSPRGVGRMLRVTLGRQTGHGRTWKSFTRYLTS